MDTPSSSPDLVEPSFRNLNASASSSRILYHVQCKVCHDYSSGKHYGIFACDGCAGFFKRSIRRSRRYVCKTNPSGMCIVNKTFRNQCRACRLRRCLAVGMNKDAVQHERGPRNSTIQKQMSIFHEAVASEIHLQNNFRLASNAVRHGLGPYIAPPAPLNLPAAYMPRMPHIPRMARMPHPHQPYVFQPAYPRVAQNIPLSPPRTEAEQIRETAATLLIKNINWIRGNRAFTDMTFDDQILLLLHCWKEFFILALAQTMMPTNFTQLFVYDSNNRSHELNVQIMRGVQNFQEVLNHVMAMNMDANEFNGLRAILLFKKTVDDSMASLNRSTNNTQQIRTLHEAHKIISIYEESRLALINHVSVRHRNQHRYGSIMQLIPLLKSTSSETIKEMFFSTAIGETSMVQLIINLYCNRNI